MVVAVCNRCCDGESSVEGKATKTTSASGIIYRNPRVYNVDYSFELVPDPNKIDRNKDLKLWIPMPREWDSQKAVKIISVQPEPHDRYVDPEYGNPMLFWDFGKETEQSSYKVDIKFRLESYDVSVKVDPEQVGSYDKTSKEYALYTRSTHTIHITPKIRELAQEAIGGETNPYLQAKRIIKFVRKKMRFKILDFERGRGIDCLLAYPVVNKKKGKEYYEGSCTQFTALMVAMCRAVGIPARSVSGYVGWNPGGDANDAKARYPFETKLSPAGLAATQFHGGLGGHMWGEFLIPNYGWIPTDPMLGKFPPRNSQRWIRYKGRDVRVGPYAPQEDSKGYGAHWVALHNGRAETLSHAVLNIGKVHTSKVTILHHSDPFPADGLAGYCQNLFVLTTPGGEKGLKNWREEVLGWPSRYMKNPIPENLDLDQFYKDYPRTRDDHEAFICHMLRRQLGNDKFFRLVRKYVDLRQKTGRAVPTSRFQELTESIYGEPLGWFFNQWVNRIGLPWLKLEKVSARKDKEGWQVRGCLLQSGDTIFNLPIELAIETKNGREKQKLWIENKKTDFEFRALGEPRKLVVDPDYEVLKLQKMPPRLWWHYDFDPEFIVIYGTLGEAQANKSIANQFARDVLEYGHEVIKADTDVNETDLTTKCVFLIGTTETNKVAQQFKDSFPIKFDGDRFDWQRMKYDKSKQGLAQVIEHPRDSEGLMIMYVGLSTEATLKFCDLSLYEADASFVIFDEDRELLRGDWEEVDSNLYWKFNTH